MIDINNIERHEWIGLNIKILKSKNKSQEGIEGRIIDETKKMIIIKTKENIKKIPKENIIFELKFDNKTKIIKGENFVLNPEERVKKVKI